MKKTNSHTILIIHKGYPLGVGAGDKTRTLNMASSLHRLGYRVILLGFFTRNIHLLRKEKRSIPPGIKSLFLFTLPNRIRLHKIAGILRAVVTFFVCKRYAVDTIQAEFASSATCARFLPDVKLVTDFHSDTVPELAMAGKSYYSIRYAARENRFALKRSDRIITVSPSLFRNLTAGHTVEPGRNYTLPSNFNIAPFQSLTAAVRSEMRERYGLSNRIVLCYSGGLHVWQCIGETLEIVAGLRKLNPDYYFFLFTTDDPSPCKQQLEALEGHCMVRKLESGEVAAFLSMADAGFVLRADSPVNINSSPTKTAEYLAAGAMVIATQYAGDAPLLIRESGCGVILSEPGGLPEQELAELNGSILRYKQDYAENAQRGQDYVRQNRTWDANEKELARLYQSLYSGDAFP